MRTAQSRVEKRDIMLAIVSDTAYTYGGWILNRKIDVCVLPKPGAVEDMAESAASTPAAEQRYLFIDHKNIQDLAKEYRHLFKFTVSPAKKKSVP